MALLDFLKPKNQQNTTPNTITEKNLTEESNLVDSKIRKLNEQSKAQNKQIKKAFKKKASKTVQGSIRYNQMYEDGICEVAEGVFSKTIRFNDINYQIAKKEQQVDIFSKYCELLNYFDSSMQVQLQVVNRYINQSVFEETMLLQNQNDGLDDYRQEENQMLTRKAVEGQNSVIRDKFLTFTVCADDYKTATTLLARAETDIVALFHTFGCKATPLSGIERLQIINDFYNPGSVFDFEYEKLLYSNLTTKDYIAPDSLDFSAKSMYKAGEQYCQDLYLKDLPPDMTDELLSELADIPCNLNISLHIQAVEQDKALDLVKKKIAFMQQQKIDEQKQALKAGYDPEMISYELKYSMKEAEDLLDDLTNKNQRMFRITMVIHTSSDDIDELSNNVYKIISVARTKNCKLGNLDYLQEEAMNSCLPLGINHIPIQRTLTTASTAILMPFTTQELYDIGGVNYGVNARSRNLIFVNRRQMMNGNGWIMGTPGAGKSVTAKHEIIRNRLQHPEDDIIVIDPEREYSKLAEAFSGEVIKISASSNAHINPLDVNVDYADEEDPLKLKTDFILSLCETILGGKKGLNGASRSVLDRACRMAYSNFFKNPKKAESPTLDDLFSALKQMSEPEAQSLALELEIYVKGSLSIFANPTNVDTDNTFIVYDIRDLGKSLKTMGMLIVLDQIWNRITANRQKGKRTWLYIDEIYLLFSNEYSAQYLFELWKRARKWGVIPTGITQNVEDLLLSDTARRMMSNSEFVCLLNQHTNDRIPLSELLGISKQQLSYVTNAPSGQGLIVASGAIVPFEDKIPTDTGIYKLITTKIDEVSEIEKGKSKKQTKKQKQSVGAEA